MLFRSEGFKKGNIRILVATDIVARGIDVVNISHVINYDMPSDAEVYVHRIGRTARAGASGTAISFMSPEELSELNSVEGLIGTTLRCEDMEDFVYAHRVIPSPEREAKKVSRMVYNGGAKSGRRRRRPRRRPAAARA